jgi:hypothetical protein
MFVIGLTGSQGMAQQHLARCHINNRRLCALARLKMSNAYSED